MIGTVLGDVYRLTGVIGRGGMGAVYEGVHLRLNKRVAIKLMARELAENTEALARFRREAEVTSQLGHPHIVQVFDFGAAPTGEPYLVMEFLEGEDLDQRIRRVGRLPVAEAAHMINQIASALAATHAKGIVHRDLKPANIFVLSVEGEKDFIKVVDFGISKVKAATTRLTAAAVVMGTPNYMSPEQAMGSVDQIDHSTDQWALACIAYEMLAGKPPFVGDNVASLLYQVVHQAPSPLTSHVADVPPGVEAVLQRALSKQQTQRFAGMTAFARAFDSAIAGGGGAAVSGGGGMDVAPLAATAAVSIATAPVSGAAPRAASMRASVGTAPPLSMAATAMPAPAVMSEPEKAKATTFSTATGEAMAPEAMATIDDKPPGRSRVRVIVFSAAVVGGAALLIALSTGVFRRAPAPGGSAGPAAAAPPPVAAPVTAVAPAPAVPPAAPAPAIVPAAPAATRPEPVVARESRPTAPTARTRRKAGKGVQGVAASAG
ncbi:MAG: eukaryotic-like serine/threonine-protein kinase, partial [Myxococcales bacterium]|nr:eukaryotic-like serine/threonine-protein kinase [Myxococcales bacterium]